MLSGMWVFGGIDRDTNEIFMVPVEDRSAATLIPIILPGSTIYSDEWASYNAIPPAEFQHLTVNHSINFVNPITQVHTQNIESTWGQAKKRMRNCMTTNTEMLDTHLAEFCRRKKFGDATLGNLLIEIRKQ